MPSMSSTFDLDHPPERGVSGRDILSIVLAREPEDLSAHERLETEREQLLTLAALAWFMYETPVTLP